VLCDDLVTLSLARPDDCVLRPLAEIDIPGQSEALIPVQLSRNLTAENAVIEPYPFSRKNFVVARSVVKSDGKLTMCKLLNPTKDVIHLNKGDTIAKISAIPSNFICEIAESSEKYPPPTSQLIPIEKCKQDLDEKGVKISGDNLSEERKINWLDCCTKIWTFLRPAYRSYQELTL